MSVDQQWDIVSGVGVTALAVAAGRAAETQRSDGLVDDPYAAMLVEAANSPLFAADSPEAATESSATASMFEQAANYIGVRSRFFDVWFDQTWSAGARQAVILASGLDTRAFRLAWPSGMRVFEIDQPKVLAFKDTVLDGAGVHAPCDRRALGVDLRDDWAAALKSAGFDTGLPTAWLAEGLLPYLPADAEYALLDTIHDFSAPGSHVAIESIGGARTQLTDSTLDEVAREWSIDLASLMSSEEREDPSERLTTHGWNVTGEALGDVAARYGRTIDGFAAHLGEHGRMLTAHLPG